MARMTWQYVFGDLQPKELFSQFWEHSPVHLRRNASGYFDQILASTVLDFLIDSAASAYHDPEDGFKPLVRRGVLCWRAEVGVWSGLQGLEDGSSGEGQEGRAVDR